MREKHTRTVFQFLILNATIATLIFCAVGATAFAAPSNKSAESVQIEVVSTKTNYHGSSPNVFKYTDVLFARVNGKNVVYSCAQKGDECPLMQNGKTYPANRVGNYTYISMDEVDAKKATAVKFKETASSW